jgi:hypothetical protein
VTEQSDTPDPSNPNIKQRDLVMELVAVTQRLGHLPSATEINEHTDYPYQRYQDEFGNLFQAFKTAGIIPESTTRSEFKQRISTEGSSDNNTAAEDAESTVSRESPSREDLINELRRIDGSLDRIPYPSDMNDEGEFTPHTYKDRFGSWDEALEAAEIDKETKLLKEIGRVAEKVGHVPSYSEMNKQGQYSATMVGNFFGGWSTAKDRFKEWREEQPSGDRSKFETSIKNDPSQEDLLDALIDVSESVGDIPTRSDMIEHCEYPLWLYGRKFESLDDAIDQSRLQNDTLKENELLFRGDLLEEITRFANVLDEPPSQELMEKYGEYTLDDYHALFGSWEAALDEAGVTAEVPDHSNWKYSNVDVLDAIIEVAEKVDHPPTTSDMNRRGKISHTTCMNRFGSWETVLKMAGLDPSKRPNVSDGATQTGDSGQRYTDTKIIEEIQRVADAVEGRPTVTEMNELGQMSSTTAANRFGSWNAALEQAGVIGTTQSDHTGDNSDDNRTEDAAGDETASDSDFSDDLDNLVDEKLENILLSDDE